MKPLVLFGTGHLAELTERLFATEGNRDVVALTLDRAYLQASESADRPVVPFEDLAEHFPPDQVDLFVAVGPTGGNGLRARVHAAAVEAGYTLASHLSPAAHVADDFKLQPGTFVFPGVRLDPFVQAGEGVMLWPEVLISHHTVVEDHAYLAPRATICGCCVHRRRSHCGVR
jgi:UDP-3-O-[3-hydroxymyristoyl] glucosamine N-acyltransferase